MELIKIYGVAYNHGTHFYKDEDCTISIGVDPYHRHRTNKQITLNGYKYDLIMIKPTKANG